MNIPFGKQGFTLIEILVVTSIISLLSSVVITATAGARDKAEIANGQRFDKNVMSVLADNLVAEWTFEDPTNLGADTSGFNQNFITTGTGQVGTGKRNSSNFLSCNTAGTCLSSSNAFDLKKSSPAGFTVSAWIKSKTYSGAPGNQFNNFLSINWENSPKRILASDNGGQIQFYFKDTGTANRLYSNGKVKQDQWSNVVITYKKDIGATSGTATIYINGKIDITGTINDSTDIYRIFDATSPNFKISMSGTMDIDDVRVYSSALSELTVEDLYNSENSVARK